MTQFQIFRKENVFFFPRENGNVPIFLGFETQKSGQFRFNWDLTGTARGSYFSSNASQYLKQDILSLTAHNFLSLRLTGRINSARNLFNSVDTMVCTSRLSFFTFFKNSSNNFTSCFIFSFTFSFETFYIILNQSIMGNKSFLPHVFKLKRKSTSTIAKNLKSKSLNENHLVTAQMSKNMICGIAPDWTYHFLHT